MRLYVMAITALSPDLCLDWGIRARKLWQDLGEMSRNRWRLFAWSLLGAAMLVLASWPLLIWWYTSNGLPLIPAAFETLLWPLVALGLGLAARGVWAALVDG